MLEEYKKFILILYYLEQFDFIVIAAGSQNILMGVPLHPFDVLKVKLIQYTVIHFTQGHFKLTWV